MEDPAKYVIRAAVTADGVVERSDVVGAVYGQTEGLIGDEFDIRALQDAERIGRIDVDIDSVGGRSTGDISIDTAMDRAETAVIAAALETIERVGPARASVTVDRIEDVRAVKRRKIVERARELLASGFEDVGLDGRTLVNAVRESTSPAEITKFADLPAGPDVETEDEVIVVEGRADVVRLLEFGITNVIGVEGTGVSSEVANLTAERTVTAFFDGDRGGDLLLLELAQIGDVDFVTFAPPGRSVEDLTMAEIYDALARKVPYEGERAVEYDEASQSEVHADKIDEPAVLGQIRSVIAENAGEVRLLGPDWTVVRSESIDDVVGLLETADSEVRAAIIDGRADQSIVDAATRNGIPLLIVRDRGEFVKRPLDVRILTGEEILDRDVAADELTV